MRSMAIATTFLALGACSGGSTTDTAEPDTAGPGTDIVAPETHEAIPQAFQGRWDFTEDTCADPGSEMRLDIEADRISYYESSATPETITQTGPGALTVDHRFSGEGEEWTETLAYSLSEDGERLTVTSPDGSMSVRMRCPA
ncbi:hypothetical protein [Parasphingopyxis lamellibrachiae]|uniref:Uncharacterized protein n=1 Tax=Parasphingopyxis lamellibrachiae TaxID=680125 RepID=A0A3D9FGU4_9SPHN|nr:hypothetical protein [Parasphingopyxis lamellibrachiae]RED17024.1 hypothetical protein DFR46_2058 [Parasphingopyxis lamellibrachiae]